MQCTQCFACLPLGVFRYRSRGFGILSGLKNLVGSKPLTDEDIQPALDLMKDHLIGQFIMHRTHVRYEVVWSMFIFALFIY